MTSKRKKKVFEPKGKSYRAESPELYFERPGRREEKPVKIVDVKKKRGEKRFKVRCEGGHVTSMDEAALEKKNPKLLISYYRAITEMI